MRTTVTFAAVAALGCIGQIVMAATIEPTAFDSPSLATAIHAAAPGDTVRLAPGTYELTEPIRPKSGIKLLGAGQEKTQLVHKGAKSAVLISINGCEDVEISGMTLDGQNNPLVPQGIGGDNSRRLWLHHLTIRNLKAKTWGPHGILFSGHNPSGEMGVTDSRITDCLIENIDRESPWGGGIRLAWGSVRNQVVGNVIRNTGRGGIFAAQSAELVIRNNRVTGSGGGGPGLGIEIWGGCPRSLIEDNSIDHWLSVDRSDQSAVRRNVIGADDGTLKFLGIEIIARDIVVTDNVVKRGAHIGLSVSNTPVKNNIYWGRNTVQDCLVWGAQLQGESGGIAHHYFYRCDFENTVRGDPRRAYKDSGHGFRTNGSCRGLVFEQCSFRNNGGFGVQFGGRDVDALDFLHSSITGNGLDAVRGPSQYAALDFTGCTVQRNKSDQLPATKPFNSPPPVAEFGLPKSIRAGEPGKFECVSRPANEIAERLWDFGDGIPEVTPGPQHTFARPGSYRVTLIVWDRSGRGGRAEQMLQVLPSKSRP
jgi:parallel beta-helix repeat protein